MPRSVRTCAFTLFCVVSFQPVFADTWQFDSLKLELPDGWELVQSAESEGTNLLNFRNGTESVTLFHRPETGLSVTKYTSTDAKQVEAPTQTKYRNLTWSRQLTSKSVSTSAGNVTTYVSHFLIESRGTTYHGFARSSSAAGAKAVADAVLNGASLGLMPKSMAAYSLTDSAFTGKKYYLGWGAAGSGDPSMMQNEVKYDVLHTNDIFTKDLGGNYIENKLIGYQNATASSIRGAWKKIGGSIGSEDMYLQYSSGHGYESGLGVGVTYKEMRDMALALPAREIVVLVMACHSGGLVNSFNSVRDQWKDWLSKGRSLLVMTSSDVNTNSATGPGTDKDEPGGANGSAGSAFGHAVWKALIGNADGFSDGVKDGFISLGELRDYARYRTKQVGGHTPVDTGTYHPFVIMNRVPSAAKLASYTGGTEGLSEDQIEEAIHRLNADLAVAPSERPSIGRE